MINRIIVEAMLAVLLLGGQKGTGYQDRQRKELSMVDQHQQVLESSKDPRELVQAAQALAASPRTADQEILLKHLRSGVFLARLDSEKEYLALPARLRLARVIKTLSKNNSRPARATLVHLTTDREFLQHESRVDLLITALVVVRPAPPEVIRFWDQYCHPEDGFSNLTAQALIENGSEPALALLEKKLADPGFDEDERLWWMHTGILAHRNDPPLLKCCERMLGGNLPDNMKVGLVESLFDYRPNEWYGPDPYYAPPPLERAAPEAREQMLRIGESALKTLPLDDAQRKTIQGRMEEIRKSGRHGG